MYLLSTTAADSNKNTCVFFTVKKVKTFKLHPKYNIKAKINEGVKEFYDYDVALIQLVDDVQISNAVRWELVSYLDLTLHSLSRQWVHW